MGRAGKAGTMSLAVQKRQSQRKQATIGEDFVGGGLIDQVAGPR